MIATPNLDVEVVHLLVMASAPTIVGQELVEERKPKRVVAVPAIGVPTRTKLAKLKAMWMRRR